MHGTNIISGRPSLCSHHATIALETGGGQRTRNLERGNSERGASLRRVVATDLY